MNLSSRQKQILDFTNSSEQSNLEAFYSQTSFFGALGVSRHENTHNNFISWLLAPRNARNNHKLGDKPLRKLLETLALVCGSLPHALGKLSQDVSNALISGSYQLSEISVEREKHIGTGRLDIYVEGFITFNDKTYPLQIVIENKIKSSERDNQTLRYQEALAPSRTRPGVYIDVYLTPLATCEYVKLGQSQCDAQSFIQLNYQYLADYVISPCRDIATSANIKQYLTEYLLALSLPALRQDSGDAVMAFSEEERDLLSRFWDKHKDLLTAAIEALAASDILEGDEHATMKKASETLQNAARRDLTKYSWTYKSHQGGTKLAKGRLVLEILSHYASQNQHVTFDELKIIFPDSLQGSHGVFALLSDAQPDNFKGHTRYHVDDAIQIADAVIAACSQWRSTNIVNFIQAAEELGYSVF